jgi:hypothetical protein
MSDPTFNARNFCSVSLGVRKANFICIPIVVVIRTIQVRGFYSINIFSVLPGIEKLVS